jgi:hypothetical protein
LEQFSSLRADGQDFLYFPNSLVLKFSNLIVSRSSKTLRTVQSEKESKNCGNDASPAHECYFRDCMVAHPIKDLSDPTHKGKIRN